MISDTLWILTRARNLKAKMGNCTVACMEKGEAVLIHVLDVSAKGKKTKEKTAEGNFPLSLSLSLSLSLFRGKGVPHEGWTVGVVLHSLLVDP